MSYVGQVTIGSTTSPVGSMLYGTCSTAAATVAKVVTCSDFDKLLTGVTIHVKFTNSNTAASPTLNVNSTGAKSIYKYGTTVPGTDSNTSWVAGSVVSFTYDGSAWQMNDHIDNTTYSAMSSSELTTGTATTSRVMRADYLKTGINSLIDTKIGALDVTGASSIGAGKTISAWSETDGKVSISTQDISITKSQVSDFPGVATLTTNGLMSSDDKHIVDGLEYIVPKTWSGLTSFRGDYVWTDGSNIYFSYNTDFQFVLDKATSTWSTKTWSGLTNFRGDYVWTDGDNIYYSEGSTQYVLNKSTSTWSTKTWSGLTSFSGGNIWTDGDNIYYSSSSTQYVLNKSNSTWSPKTWSGLTNFYSLDIWTDGDNIYYSNTQIQMVLDKSTSTWSEKTWSGFMGFSGRYVWTDGDNIYYSEGAPQFVLNKSTSEWSTKTWSGLQSFYGSRVWTDGDNIYYSYIDGSSGSNYQINVPHHPISVNRRYTISSSKWSSSANSNGYYTYTLTTFDYDFSTNNIPSICITGSSSSAVPTSTEISAFRSLLAPNGYIDQTGPHTFVLYAKTKPTTTFYIRINQISGTLSKRACKSNCRTM